MTLSKLIEIKVTTAAYYEEIKNNLGYEWEVHQRHREYKGEPPRNFGAKALTNDIKDKAENLCKKINRRISEL